MIAVAGAALFLTHLGQILKMLGLSTAIQFMIYGAAIAVGMAFGGVQASGWRGPAAGWRPRLGASPPETG
jgi:ribose transport system permease protein